MDVNVDKIIQITTNAVPLKAVFGDGSVTPVVGLALVQSKVVANDNSKTELKMNLPGGIAIFNELMVICEQVEGFIGYAADDAEAKDIYERWYKNQQRQQEQAAD